MPSCNSTPLIGSLNDATQIVFGLLTGHNYAGIKMEAGEYALYAAGIVIGMLPASRAILKFGALIIDRPLLFLSGMLHKVPALRSPIVKVAGQLLGNEIGGIGTGIEAIAKYRKLLSDNAQLERMLSALRPHNSLLTVAGRKFSHHWQSFGFGSALEFQTTYRTQRELNLAGEKLVYQALTEGKPANRFQQTLNLEVTDFMLPNGIAARFSAVDNTFITFVKLRTK